MKITMVHVDVTGDESTIKQVLALFTQAMQPGSARLELTPPAALAAPLVELPPAPPANPRKESQGGRRRVSSRAETTAPAASAPAAKREKLGHTRASEDDVAKRRDVILEFMKPGPVTLSQVSRKLGVSYGIAHNDLKQLKAQGRITRAGQNYILAR